MVPSSAYYDGDNAVFAGFGVLEVVGILPANEGEASASEEAVAQRNGELPTQSPTGFEIIPGFPQREEIAPLKACGEGEGLMDKHEDDYKKMDYADDLHLHGK